MMPSCVDLSDCET